MVREKDGHEVWNIRQQVCGDVVTRRRNRCARGKPSVLRDEPGAHEASIAHACHAYTIRIDKPGLDEIVEPRKVIVRISAAHIAYHSPREVQPAAGASTRIGQQHCVALCKKREAPCSGGRARSAANCRPDRREYPATSAYGAAPFGSNSHPWMSRPSGACQCRLRTSCIARPLAHSHDRASARFDIRRQQPPRSPVPA